ncbi:MAG: hypothetical protein ACK4WM_09475, partial [Thermoflexales bacterium]
VGEAPVAEQTAASSDPHRGRAAVMLILAIVISVAVILLSARFRDVLIAFGQLGLLGLFVLSVVGNATVLIPAPAFVVACAAAPIYGVLATGLVAGVGSAVGEMTGYMAGYGGTAVLPQGKLYQRMHNLMERFGPLALRAVDDLRVGALPQPDLRRGRLDRRRAQDASLRLFPGYRRRQSRAPGAGCAGVQRRVAASDAVH